MAEIQPQMSLQLYTSNIVNSKKFSLGLMKLKTLHCIFVFTILYIIYIILFIMSIFRIFSLSSPYSLAQLGKKVNSKYLVLVEEVLKSKDKNSSREIKKTKSSLKRNRKYHKL